MKYRAKPGEVEARQWNGRVESATEIIDWILTGDQTARWHEYDDVPARATHIAIDTVEGTMRAYCGDWVIRGAQGEFYPCKPNVFEATYELAEAVQR